MSEYDIIEEAGNYLKIENFSHDQVLEVLIKKKVG